ncbi:MAG: hybrid sensor histidine kinase/response regulator [Magnetococcus sp. WYHC-3]
MNEEKPKILLVDDEPINIRILSDILRPHYRLSVARNGEQALERSRTSPRPDLVLLDIIMPGMDGFEVARRLRAHPDTQDIPVIFSTALGDERSETQGFDAGGVDFLSRPISPPRLLARVATHLKLREQQRHLRELNDQKNHLLGMAAHDLRNPVNTIRGFSEILLQEELTADERREFLQIIHRLSHSMLTLINDLLDVTIIESGRLDLRLSPGDLGDLLADRLPPHVIAAHGKGIRLHSEVNEHLAIPYDANRMGQVLDNLVGNAIKFSPPGTTVTVTVGRVPSGMVLEVRDQGPGLTEEDRTRLFGTFQRLSAQPTGGETSSGLGLAIAKRIVDAHGGRITEEGQLGSGAVFRVFLPDTGEIS